MEFIKIDTMDLCEDVAVFWGALSDVSEALQCRARELDGEEYDARGFGVCVGYDFTKKDFFFFTDEDPATGGGNIFYVDKDGDRHWFQAEIGDALTERIFNACDRIRNCVDTPQGYAIQKTVRFDNGRGMVLAAKDDAAHPFTVWMFKETQSGFRDYIWSRCFADEITAEKAFANAVAERTGHSY